MHHQQSSTLRARAREEKEKVRDNGLAGLVSSRKTSASNCTAFPAAPHGLPATPAAPSSRSSASSTSNSVTAYSAPPGKPKAGRLDQRVRRHLQIQRPEPAAAGDIGHRLTFFAPVDQRGESRLAV
ncbi:MAG: hypothetical protein WDW36_005310 [Sanguina aurantia]